MESVEVEERNVENLKGQTSICHRGILLETLRQIDNSFYNVHHFLNFTAVIDDYPHSFSFKKAKKIL